MSTQPKIVATGIRRGVTFDDGAKGTKITINAVVPSALFPGKADQIKISFVEVDGDPVCIQPSLFIDSSTGDKRFEMLPPKDIAASAHDFALFISSLARGADVLPDSEDVAREQLEVRMRSNQTHYVQHPHANAAFLTPADMLRIIPANIVIAPQGLKAVAAAITGGPKAPGNQTAAAKPGDSKSAEGKRAEADSKPADSNPLGGALSASRKSTGSRWTQPGVPGTPKPE